MARHRRVPREEEETLPDSAVDAGTREHANALAKFCERPVKKKKKPRAIRPLSAVARARAAEEMLAMIASGDWSKATGSHFVQLYGHMHKGVYGISPEEIAGKDGTYALFLANNMLAKSFGGDGDEMASFVRWCWKKLAREEKERRVGIREDTFRLTWRYQFSERLLTDYRLDGARRAKG